ncbi:MAG: hypothetical protein QM741_15775 [Rudaea sp.]|uniref:hypothetical protein n=1 Tax=Rudaea sp. TaxID=2136325 RepID=UPI0039E3D800
MAFLVYFTALSIPLDRAAAEGEAVNGYPNWAERVLLEWMNRARSDPQADLAACPSGSCLESSCYGSPAAPRHLDFNLERSARFHGDHMRINGYFDHSSHCTLVSNVAALYPNTCSGAASCSCTQGALSSDQTAWTKWDSRMQMFGATVSSAGEIIAAGYSGPNASFYAWLYEPAANSSCDPDQNNGNGHRFLILTGEYGPAAGAGYTSTGNFAVMDFAGTASDGHKIPSGSHYPQQAATVDAWANWYDSAGPSSAKINVDGVCSNMTLSRGSSTNGAWHASVSGVGSGCHRYQFAFKDSSGNSVLYPSAGSLGIGNGSATCPDWNSTVLPSCDATTTPTTSPFVALNPARLLDTRGGAQTVDAQYAGTGALYADNQIDLAVLGRGGLPAAGVGAVALNVTATNPSAPGYVTVWPGDASRPLASNLNFTTGRTTPNLVVVKVGANGLVSLFNSAGLTDLIADVVGYFGATSSLTATTPARLLDTRAGAATVDGQFQGGGAMTAGATLGLSLAGRAGMPQASGLGAAILNFTVASPTAPGYLTVWPNTSAQPPTSNLNFVAGLTVPNLVIGKVGTDGKVAVYNSAGSTEVIADLEGWFPASSELASLVPARLMDTRSGATTVDGTFAGTGALAAGGSVNLTVLNRGGVPASGVGAVVLNVTVAGASAPGYITVWPTGSTKPLASSLNFVAGQVVPNAVIARVGTGGKVSLFNSSGSTHLVVDVVGWFAQ